MSFKGDTRIQRGVPRAATPTAMSHALNVNKHMSADVTTDWRQAVNAPIVVGGESKYEVTVELLPGWPPYASLDDVTDTPEAIRAAFDDWRELALDPQRSKFLRSDPLHGEAADNGRKFVLNETGSYSPGNFARLLPPYVADRYQPFDFAQAGVKDYDFVNGDQGLVPLPVMTWARIPRPFADPLTHRTDAPQSPLVECSYDGGVTWYEQQSNGVTFANDEAALLFTDENPLSVKPPSWAEVVTLTTQEPTNMFFAIIERRFRIRVTATVIGDQMLIPRRGTDAFVPGSPMDLPVAHVFDRPQFRYEIRRECGSRLATLLDGYFVAPDIRHDERMDLVAADAYRKQIGRALGDKRISGSAESPWIDTTAAISRRVISVEGIGLSTRVREGDDAAFPNVVGVTHKLDFPQSTRVTISDSRHEPEIPREDA